MATLVISTNNENGTVQQVQVGPADIVATVSAGYSLWGWIGGLNGIGSILRLGSNAAEQRRIGELYEVVDPGLAACRILGQTGLEAVSLVGDQTFGETTSSKLVGMTLCALAHMMRPQSAVSLFMEYFATALFEKGLSKLPGSKEVLNTFLIDQQQVILNGGTVHGLPERFDRAIAELQLKFERKASSHPKHKNPLYAADRPLINGFLKWLTENASSPYHTRSAHAARLAVCLKIIGYKITHIIVWNGVGDSPGFGRDLVLVTGGASETDPFMDEHDFKGWSIDLVTHYRWATVGSMLWNSFVQESTTSQETFQQDFDEIDHAISQDLKFRWAFVDTTKEEIEAFAEWSGRRPPRAQSNSKAVRLATILFPQSVDEISKYYVKIAEDSYLSAAKSTKARTGEHRNVLGPNKELQRFLTISASICLAVLAQLGGSEFRDIQHSTTIDLSTMDHLRWLCNELDNILSGGCGTSRVITAIASMHCAMEFPASTGTDDSPFYGGDTEQLDDSLVVGWRNGKYAILPNLLFSLEQPLKRSVLNLRCVDVFIANLPTRRKGSITCPRGLPPALEFSSQLLKDAGEGTDVEQQLTTRNGAQPITLSAPRKQAPDKPIYINLERPTFGNGDPEVVLCGRIDGESMGTIGIQDVLATLALSWSDGEGFDRAICAGQHPETTSQPGDQLPARIVFNVPASTYADSGHVPRCDRTQEPRYHVYVPVADSTPWAVFLAGQSYVFNRVTFGCTDCAVNAGPNSVSTMSGGLRTLIGYK